MQTLGPATLLKRNSNTGAFLWNLQNFWEYLFWRTSANYCFYIFSIIFYHYFHYHHIHYHRKIHLYYLRTLLTIPLDCIMIPCLFQLNFVFFLPLIFFFSLIPNFAFLRPVKGLRIRFRCPLYTYIYIYSYLHFILYTYLLILIYTHIFILMFFLYIMWSW